VKDAEFIQDWIFVTALLRGENPTLPPGTFDRWRQDVDDYYANPRNEKERLEGIEYVKNLKEGGGNGT
jgi:hypothetical protein